VLAMAVRIARAATGRDQVAFCGYHGWSDWYLAANIADQGNLDSHLLPGLSPAGVPGALRGTALPFHYNDIDELRRIVSANGSQLAAIVMEPCRSEQPKPGFLEAVRAIANSCGAVLIFDEITSGWRMTTGGIHLTMGVTPHLATFAKCMSNGYPMAAVIGTRTVMDAAQNSFISSTYWTERVGPAAALATIKKHISVNLPLHLIAAGSRIQEGWRKAAATVGLNIKVSGIPPLSTFVLDQDEPAPLMTLFAQEMLARGYLAGGQVYTMLAHTDDLIDAYLENVGEVFGFMAAAVQAGDIDERLNGPVKYDQFHRLA